MVVETVPKNILDLLSSAILAKASTIAWAAVSVDNTATQLLITRSTRTGFIVVNNSTQTVYLGGPTITTATGLPLEAGASYSNQDWVGVFYGIVAADTSDVRVQEFY